MKKQLSPEISNFPINLFDKESITKMEKVVGKIDPEITVLDKKIGALWKLYKKEIKKSKKKEKAVKELEKILEDAEKNILALASLRRRSFYGTATRAKPSSFLRMKRWSERQHQAILHEVVGGVYKGVKEEDIPELRELIRDHELHGFRFIGFMGSRLSFDIGGDYDLLFTGPREKIPEPTVVQRKTKRGVQVELITLPHDLGPEETTHIKFQPVAYPVLVNSLVIPGRRTEEFLSRLEGAIAVGEVRKKYVYLALSVMNFKGRSSELWTGSDGKRYDYAVIESDSSKFLMASRALKRSCLDFLPRAVFLQVFGRFPRKIPSENETVHVRLLSSIKKKAQELESSGETEQSEKLQRVVESLLQLESIVTHLMASQIGRITNESSFRELLEKDGPLERELSMADFERIIPEMPEEGQGKRVIDSLSELLSSGEITKSKIKAMKVKLLQAVKKEIEILVSGIMVDASLEFPPELQV